MQHVALVQPPGRLHDWAVLTCLSGSQMYSTLCWAEHVVAAVWRNRCVISQTRAAMFTWLMGARKLPRAHDFCERADTAVVAECVFDYSGANVSRRKNPSLGVRTWSGQPGFDRKTWTNRLGLMIWTISHGPVSHRRYKKTCNLLCVRGVAGGVCVGAKDQFGQNYLSTNTTWQNNQF
jgi:hypothetical protein